MIKKILFSNQLLVDTRVPIISFGPIYGYTIGITNVSIEFFLQVLFLLILQLVTCIILSIITYYYIIIPRVRYEKLEKGKRSSCSNNNTNQNKLSATTNFSIFLVGFGFIIPLSIIVPYIWIDYFDIRNVTIRFSIILLPVTIVLKTIVAMFGILDSTPILRMSTKSLRHFIYYMGGVFIPKYNYDDYNEVHSNSSTSHIKKTNNTQNKNVYVQSEHILKEFSINIALNCLRLYVLYTIPLSIVGSILKQYRYKVLPSSDQLLFDIDSANTIAPTLELRRLYNNFIIANILFVSLMLSMNAIVLFIMIVFNGQFDTLVFSTNPLLFSTSPSSFWGENWNLLVHTCLKDGVYKPILLHSSSTWNGSNNKRNRSNKIIATIVTFLVSGLLHEMVFLLLMYNNKHEVLDARIGACTTCIQPIIGKHMIFFGWNGILIVLEQVFENNFAITLLQKHIPTLIQCHFVTLLSLPVSHLFTDDLIISGYFDGVLLGVPLITIMQ